MSREKKAKCLIRIFEDGSAEILEGKSFKYFLEQERAALSFLLSHSWARPKIGEIKWLPLKKVEIER